MLNDFINRLLENLSEFLAARPGFLPLVGLALILINLLLQFVPGSGAWLVDSNLLLHIGLIIGIAGILLIRPLD